MGGKRFKWMVQMLKARDAATERKLRYKTSRCPLCEGKLFADVLIKFEKVRIPMMNPATRDVDEYREKIVPVIAEAYPVVCEDCGFHVWIPAGELPGYWASDREIEAFIKAVINRGKKLWEDKKLGIAMYRVYLERLPNDVRVNLYNLVCDMARVQGKLRDDDSARGVWWW